VSPVPATAILERRLQGILFPEAEGKLRIQVSVSVREAVLVAGVLRGMELEAPCIVRAIKVSLPKLDVWEYVKADIAEAPPSLPLGGYDVSFEGRKMRVSKTAQGWISEQA